MKIFVFEYVTGGGLYREPLPASLVREGDMMLSALLRDLSDIPGVETITSRDCRLPELPLADQVVTITPDGDFERCWQQCVDDADAVWLIAPETGGVLADLSQRVVDADKVLLGCQPAAVAIATSKLATSARLAAHGIQVVPTFRLQDLPDWDGPWVAKPDDGAGCEETRRFVDRAEMQLWLVAADRVQSHSLQPYLPGEAASLSMLCSGGRAWLLSCNRQLITVSEGTFSYHGSVLNGMANHWAAFEDLARRIAHALPGLAGYVGVDLIVSAAGMTVLEINPRLTTSYVGLRCAMDCNPAQLVLDMFYNAAFERPLTMARNVVEISLDQ